MGDDSTAFSSKRTETWQDRAKEFGASALAMIRGKGGGAGFFRVLIVTLLVLFGLLVASVNYVLTPTVKGQEMPLTRVLRYADTQQIKTATFLEEDQHILGTYCTVPPKNGKCDGGSIQDFWTAYDRNSGTQQLLENIGKAAEITVDPQTAKGEIRFAMTFILPLMILANLFGLIFLAKSGQGSISDIVGFGSIGRRKKGQRASTGVTFADVAGADEAVAELAEVRDYLNDPTKYAEVGALPPKGVLLLGPPGCGKTLLAKAAAGESDVPFFSMSGAEFVESLVGVGAARVRDLFKQAQENAPAIIFIDELDAAARRRNLGGGSGGTDEREQTLNQMLVAMDGFEVSSGVVVMGATNRPDILDPALLRPGRFDRHVTVSEPDYQGRLAILTLHATKRPLHPDVDLEYLAHRSPGFTGADLANVANEAALLAIREGKKLVEMTHFEEAIQRVIAGPQRRGHLMTDEERARLSYHESGHALVAATLGHNLEVHRISIVARGRGLGQSALAGQDSDRMLFTRTELIDQMVVAMGGTAAEELLFNEPSTTAEKDIEKVTDLARQVIGRYGMSSQLGPVRLMSKDLDIYLGGEAHSLVTVAPITLEEFDREVRKTVEFAKQRATDICVENRKHLDKLAGTLMEAETLEGPRLEALLAPLKPVAKAAAPARSNGNGATKGRSRKAAETSGTVPGS